MVSPVCAGTYLVTTLATRSSHGAARRRTPPEGTSCVSVGFYGAHGTWRFTRGYTRRIGRCILPC